MASPEPRIDLAHEFQILRGIDGPAQIAVVAFRIEPNHAEAPGGIVKVR
jgi:hypothetical protein